MKALLLSLLLLCVCIPAIAKSQPELESAKVISQNIGAYNSGIAVMPVGTMLAGVPITRRSNIVVIETATQRLTWSEAGRKMIVLPVNGTIHFYRDGNWFIVRDSKGKKHRFGLVHMETIQNQSAK